MKAFKMIFLFRLFAVCDVLFSEKFELYTWDKKGKLTAKTHFWRTEIKQAGKSGTL